MQEEPQFVVRETETGEGWLFSTEEEALKHVVEVAKDADAAGVGYEYLLTYT